MTIGIVIIITSTTTTSTNHHHHHPVTQSPSHPPTHAATLYLSQAAHLCQASSSCAL